jgi:hypothetical protein
MHVEYSLGTPDLVFVFPLQCSSYRETNIEWVSSSCTAGLCLLPTSDNKGCDAV